MEQHNTPKEWLLGKTIDQLTEIALSLGLRRFVGAQIAEWLYKKQVTEIAQMSNISKKLQLQLEDKYQIGGFDPVNTQTSRDGTKKYIFPSLGNSEIESVYIPDKERATLCLSSQRGCKMGCQFCFTAQMGFSHNLSSGEIISQMIRIPETSTLTNVVFMGMGEPLDNPTEVFHALEIMTATWGLGWSPTRITLSTIGVLPSLKEFLAQSKVHLAVSLHNPFSEERKAIMPIENKYAIEDIITEISKFDFTHQRRVSFEYIMFNGVNDAKRHLNELIRLLKPIGKARVNLISFHPIPNSPLKGSTKETILWFNTQLNKAGILATTRNSRGLDIFAACGMLANKKILPNTTDNPDTDS